MSQLHLILSKKRESKGWNKSQMARALGVSSQLYGQYESKQKTPKADFFIKWKEVFKEDLLSRIETNVSQETEPEPPSRNSLEKTLENMSEDKIRTTAIIERLVTLLEKQFQDGGGPRLAPPGTPGTIPITKGEKKTSR